MSKRTQAHAAGAGEKSTERVFTLYLQRDDDPKDAGRRAADQAFDGLGAAIQTIVAQQMKEKRQLA